MDIGSTHLRPGVAKRILVAMAFVGGTLAATHAASRQLHIPGFAAIVTSVICLMSPVKVLRIRWMNTRPLILPILAVALMALAVWLSVRNRVPGAVTAGPATWILAGVMPIVAACLIDDLLFTLCFRKRFVYRSNEVYRIGVSSDALTSVQLERGEVAFFDRPLSPWIAAGTAIPPPGERRQQTILLRAPATARHTELTIRTDRRAYHLRLVVDEETYSHDVTWRYPNEPTPTRTPGERGPFGTVRC